MGTGGHSGPTSLFLWTQTLWHQWRHRGVVLAEVKLIIPSSVSTRAAVYYIHKHIILQPLIPCVFSKTPMLSKQSDSSPMSQSSGHSDWYVDRLPAGDTLE